MRREVGAFVTGAAGWRCDMVAIKIVMRLKPLLPVLILGALLLAIVFLARFTQRKMHEHETGAKHAPPSSATSAPSKSPEAPPPNPNSVLDEHVERERLAELFPDTLVNVWGIRYKILREGAGPKPVSGNRITAHYRGRLLDGTEFDNSYTKGSPIKFTLMSNGVIRGWNESFIDMRKGEQRLIVIPYKYAYGSNGRGPIPPRAPLVFEVELIDFE
jgi:FKBP-type peptidyl-prolyl cis-trans isomerase